MAARKQTCNVCQVAKPLTDKHYYQRTNGKWMATCRKCRAEAPAGVT